MHELCHLKAHHHSRRYDWLLREIMPGWEPVKAKLDGMAELLLNEGDICTDVTGTPLLMA